MNIKRERIYVSHQIWRETRFDPKRINRIVGMALKNHELD